MGPLLIGFPKVFLFFVNRMVQKLSFFLYIFCLLPSCFFELLCSFPRSCFFYVVHFFIAHIHYGPNLLTLWLFRWLVTSSIHFFQFLVDFFLRIVKFFRSSSYLVTPKFNLNQEVVWTAWSSHFVSNIQ